MSVFGKLLKSTINVAALPLEAVRDVCTFGGVATEQKKPYVVQRLEKLVGDVEGDEWSATL